MEDMYTSHNQDSIEMHLLYTQAIQSDWRSHVGESGEQTPEKGAEAKLWAVLM